MVGVLFHFGLSLNPTWGYPQKITYPELGGRRFDG